MKRRLFGLIVVGSWMVASPAWALFNAQVLSGKRKSSFDAPSPGTGGDSLTASELRFAAHLDPIPLVPVGFGLAMSQTTFDESRTMQVEKIEGTDFDLEVEAWLPLEVSGLVPYAKVGYTIGGQYRARFMNLNGGTEPTVTYKPSGATFKVGLKYEFLFRLGVMIEVEGGKRKLEYEKISNFNSVVNIDNSQLNQGKDIFQNSQSILIGVQAGL